MAVDASARDGFLPGDIALADVLLLHGYAMGGGLLDAVESLTGDQVDAAIRGFMVLGMPDLAALVRDVRERATSSDPDVLEALELEASSWYAALVPSDSVLDRAFQPVLDDRPELFAAV